MSEIFNLKPKGSLISCSTLTDTAYHVIKFYTRVKREGDIWEFVGYEATEKHKLGECRHCD